MQKRKIACRLWVWKPGPPVPQSSRYTHALPDTFKKRQFTFLPSFVRSLVLNTKKHSSLKIFQTGSGGLSVGIGGSFVGLKRSEREPGTHLHGEHSDSSLYTADFAQRNTSSRRPVISARFAMQHNRRCMMGKTLVK